MDKVSKPDWAKIMSQALTEPGKVGEHYSLFHEYSLGNYILAMMQMQDKGLPIAPIASFKKWQSLGRNVKKGEKAIGLIMPIMVKKKFGFGENEDDATVMKIEKSKEQPAAATFTIFALKNNWFSVDQTEGAEFSQEKVKVDWDAEKALDALGITKTLFDEADGNRQGWAKPTKKEIGINPIASYPMKTTFHEMAHCLLHGKEDRMIDGVRLEKGMVEAEAEMTAYLCCATLGMDGLDESRSYIQGWLGDESVHSEFAKKSASRVFSAADKILRAGRSAVITTV